MSAVAKHHRKARVAAHWSAAAGLVLSSFGVLAPRASADPSGGAVTVLGGHGPGQAANQLNIPVGVALDGQGDVFVSDLGNDRVQEWTPGATQGITVAGGHGPGQAANQLNSPGGVALDGHGDVFVADSLNERVQEWTPGATQGITVAGGHGAGANAGQFSLNSPRGVAVDGNGDVFTADIYNNRVQEWTPGATQGVTVAGGHGVGRAPNELWYPDGLAVDSHNDIFVADSINYRVQEWTPGAVRGITVAGGRGSGSADNQLSIPEGMAMDANGDVFVTDPYNYRVQEWTPGAAKGITVAGGHGQGSGADQLNNATAVAVDGNGHVFVADTGNNRVQEITLPPYPTPLHPTTTTLTYYTTTSDKEAPPVQPGDEVILFATVKPLQTTGQASGMVDFSEGATDLGAVAVHPNQGTGYTILFTAQMAAGTHTITARYSGDSTFEPSSPLPISIVIPTH